ncbi:transposase 3 domain protein [Escherichia coli 3-020-07_S3_C1]|nr:transposase 3 domain protein [Escherichia coli 2-460-02_S4_C2]KDY72487.1 transposase 3 domain protein [Escherichia coli 2-460-02_S4_C3]KDZ34055.1 transposase 3 domain protein [Escherichia coli 3-020-07_S3_C1]KEJ39552.1 transposase 3 domain protein [Escherichia coli 2-460-02_S4_C1]
MSTRGFALSLGCGEHCWLDHIRNQKYAALGKMRHIQTFH